jgi:hypothetical protein
MDNQQTENGGLKTCPRCAEAVKAEAKVCRFCGFDFEADRHERLVQEQRASEPWWKKSSHALKASWDQTQKKERQRNRHPVSCCGCSCGTVIATLAVGTALVVSLGAFSLVPAIAIGFVSSLAAIHLLNIVLRVL